MLRNQNIIFSDQNDSVRNKRIDEIKGKSQYRSQTEFW